MKVLITDDEALVLDDSLYVIRQILPSAEIVTAGSYADAVAVAMGQKLDVAFLDIEMPEQNGMELAKRLQELQPNINIIFLTGYSQYAIEAYKLRASDYLLKPLMEEDVKHALESLRYSITEEGEVKSAIDNRKKIQVTCFDHFTVMCDGQPIAFRRAQAKELLAYLISKRGVGSTTEELCDVLWPEDGDNKKQYCWKIVSELRLSMKNAGLEDMILSTREDYSIDPSRIECDYYDYLDGKIPWNGKFMEQYSLWAEEIKGKMTNG